MAIVRGASNAVHALAPRAVQGLLQASFILCFAFPAVAQVDPRVIEQLQGRLQGTQDPGAQVDRAREQSDRVTLPATSQITSEERELRRQQSRIQLDSIYLPSPVERQYRERLGDPALRQFGYDLFRVSEGGSGSVTGEVSDGYLLGPGDELVVTFQGATNSSHNARVARDGRLIVASLPPIRAAGRTLGSVRTSLAEATRQNLLGTDVFVSLGGVRSATVLVGGEVERPGQYQVTALSDVANALALAGGVRKAGSLRNIRLVRGGVTRIVDLYALLGIGTAPRMRLQDGDRIVVPVVGNTVAVTGSVARPGIYELHGSASVSEVLAYAGGALYPRGYQISISRIGEDGREIFVRPQGTAAAIWSGDGVQVLSGSAGAALDRIVLAGHVRNPGPRALSAVPTLADLIGGSEGLRLGTYMPMAIIIRRNPVTGMRTYEAADLRSALDRSRPVALRGDDRVYVFSADDIAFLNSSATRQIILGQENPKPQCFALEKLESLVADTQSPRFNVITRGTITVEREGRDVAASDGRALTGAGTSGSDQSLEAMNARPMQDFEQLPRADREQNDPQRNDQRQYDPRQRNAPDFDPLSPRNIECPPVFEDVPELLPVLIEHSVSVGGAVRRPGAYPVASTISADTLISASDGVMANVRDPVLDISPASGAFMRYEMLNGQEAQLANVIVSAGDDIRVTANNAAYEAGAVLLTGEFNSPGLYTIRKGERLSELVARAGGLSDQAYPYGAIFTRRSVREQQQEGFQRTARELNTSLLALAAQENVNGQSIVAAGELIRTLSETQAVGRMVVEADPRVLTQRPDLDPILDGGDTLHIPKKPTYVLALGDVSNPGAVQFQPGKSVSEYVSEAGGTQSTADDGRVFLVLPNGSAQPVRSSFWRRSNAVVPPGSTIIVPKNLQPLRTLGIVRDVATIFGQLATAVASVAILADRN
ncbi:SLBB domain-containing protein [Sphingosinicella soli]|uniref:Protein involved in polysaccharide export with SLBB domain n=1 Tax=Sphingosinicella soli TaxID=333708 RepID=A0A7W7B3T0_9SPHN|nr:SLBB domain-containing protein [Sphingosinicella soli]MBB4632520.1 protein involved in polysaccharide export with SLBB domain [Sphingosinicella soli]